MKTNSQNTATGNQPKENVRQGNQTQKGKNIASNKNNAAANIKDLPEIDHARPGVV